MKFKVRGTRKSSGMGERNETPIHEGESLSGAGLHSSYQSTDSHTEQAEDLILFNLEAQTRRTQPIVDGFRPAVPGERAPLGVDSVGSALSDNDEAPHSPTREKRPSFKQMARRVQTMNRSMSDRSVDRSVDRSSLSQDSSQGEAAAGHRRARTLLESIDEKPGEDMGHELFTDFNTDIFSADVNPNMYHEGLEFLWNQDMEEEILAQEQAASEGSPESQPLLSSGGGEGDQPDADFLIEQRLRLARKRRNELRMKRLANCLNPINVIKRIFHILFHSTLVLSIPFFGIAWILFYYIGNPQLDFLPGQATISWWLNFVGRQLLLFELARLTEFILIDILVMSSRVVVQMLGPWVTIFCLQSKGWPFLVAFWGCYSMVLLHGDNPFQTHWLYWTGIEIYSRANSGSYIISSSAYLRVLFGMILAGVATALKRTLLTLYFGKRSFDIYKPQLEEILNDIIVITEIAELGAMAGDVPEEGTQVDTNQLVEESLKKRGQLTNVRWSSLRFDDKNRKESIGRDTDDESDDEADDEDTKKNAEEEPPVRTLLARTSPMDSSSSGLVKIKNLLDRWEEPVNKLDKSSASNVNDVLKFRKALTYMDLEHPFGEAFGPASTRNELIKSAQILYQRLLKLSPGSRAIPNSVLSVLSENGDGTVDRNIKKSVNHLFPADVDGEIPILAFIQNCDVVYRRLRYFRASVGNNSVIDTVLENIINGFFAFGLAVVILSLLNFNPWPLLVSVSTLLVSFAFAIGPTAAKAIEGIILIVGTRPFDIGDRIIIANSPGLPSAGVGDSWFVQDISLFSTTLRMAANNELATVSNGSIASTRITNCARSKNAVVVIALKLHISVQNGLNLEKFKDGLENYVSDNPAIWDMLIFLRCDDIDSDNEFVMCRLAVRSRHSWQVAARILEDRGRLFQFCTELSKEMEVNYDSPPPRRILYYGGNLVSGAVKDFKKDLLMDENNIINGDPSMMFGSRRSFQPAATPEADREDSTPVDTTVDDLFLTMVQQSQN